MVRAGRNRRPTRWREGTEGSELEADPNGLGKALAVGVKLEAELKEGADVEEEKRRTTAFEAACPSISGGW